MAKAYFHLPGLFAFSTLYEDFLRMYVNEKDKFNDWAEIGSVYGNPKTACWGGGRMPKNTEENEDFIVDFMKDYGINCRLTFTNALITEKHLGDFMGNNLLKKFYWGNNSIIINSPVLEKYIRENYPRYNIISSTTKCLNNPDDAAKELSNDYEMVVLDYNFNKDFAFLKDIKEKGKCELLINPVCQPNCPRRAQHYKVISEAFLHQADLSQPFECPYQAAKFYQAKENPLFIGIDDIQNIYMPMGFKHFKIEGRTTHIDDMIEILLYYLVKPEYQLEIRERLYFGGIKDDIKYLN